MNIVYTFDNMLFSTYGVKVSNSTGLMGVPKRKAPEKYDFPGETGMVVDLSVVAWEPRTIVLDCFIIANDAATLISNYQTFTKTIFNKTAKKNLVVAVGATNLTFSVYVEDISDLDKAFIEGKNVGKFKIKFIEPEPTVS
jgi:hypothetical protein